VTKKLNDRLLNTTVRQIMKMIMSKKLMQSRFKKLHNYLISN